MYADGLFFRKSSVEEWRDTSWTFNNKRGGYYIYSDEGFRELINAYYRGVLWGFAEGEREEDLSRLALPEEFLFNGGPYK